MYTQAIAGPYAASARLVGFCDTNALRMDYANRTHFPNGPAVPCYPAKDFDRMISETRPDTVIVTTMDSTHADYICRAMELGCDVVTEKPMTTDEAKCRRILKTVRATGRKLQVTFNYRYSPPRSQVREILASGAIGKVLSVDFAWLLDTKHGADYFRRWHRRRENSGSLLVHKATHHFDLVNWWLADDPQEVFAHGSLKYYTEDTARRLGLSGHGDRCIGCGVFDRCPLKLDIVGNEYLKAMYRDTEPGDGYQRDRCVFSGEINIWDTMSVAVRYKRGALLSYQLHAYSPYEGYRIAFNGTKGRLEHVACEDTYVNGDGSVPGELQRHNTTTTIIPEFEKPRSIEVAVATGGHGGGDDPLLADIFDPNSPADPLKRKAGERDGAYSILVGVAAYHSIDRGAPVQIADLLGDEPL